MERPLHIVHSFTHMLLFWLATFGSIIGIAVCIYAEPINPSLFILLIILFAFIFFLPKYHEIEIFQEHVLIKTHRCFNLFTQTKKIDFYFLKQMYATESTSYPGTLVDLFFMKSALKIKDINNQNKEYILNIDLNNLEDGIKFIKTQTAYLSFAKKNQQVNPI